MKKTYVMEVEIKEDAETAPEFFGTTEEDFKSAMKFLKENHQGERDIDQVMALLDEYKIDLGTLLLFVKGCLVHMTTTNIPDPTSLFLKLLMEGFKND